MVPPVRCSFSPHDSWHLRYPCFSLLLCSHWRRGLHDEIFACVCSRQSHAQVRQLLPPCERATHQDVTFSCSLSSPLQWCQSNISVCSSPRTYWALLSACASVDPCLKELFSRSSNFSSLMFYRLPWSVSIYLEIMCDPSHKRANINWTLMSEPCLGRRTNRLHGFPLLRVFCWNARCSSGDRLI